MKRRFLRDWEFYLAHIDVFTFCGEEVKAFPYSEAGLSAKECFYKWDSTGCIFPCKEPELLRKVIITKKAINFQIKQWAEGWQDVGESLNFYLSTFTSPPNWVANSIVNQLKQQLARP